VSWLNIKLVAAVVYVSRNVDGKPVIYFKPHSRFQTWVTPEKLVGQNCISTGWGKKRFPGYWRDGRFSPELTFMSRLNQLFKWSTTTSVMTIVIGSVAPVNLSGR